MYALRVDMAPRNCFLPKSSGSSNYLCKQAREFHHGALFRAPARSGKNAFRISADNMRAIGRMAPDRPKTSGQSWCQRRNGPLQTGKGRHDGAVPRARRAPEVEVVDASTPNRLCCPRSCKCSTIFGKNLGFGVTTYAICESACRATINHKASPWHGSLWVARRTSATSR